MRFFLFSKISFEVSHPIALIESYCFQSDFYANYDLPNYRNRSIENVNKIGARIEREETLRECKDITKETKDLAIFKYVFKYDLDKFLELDDETRNRYINEFYDKVIRKLMEVKGIGLPKATKVLHTLYPEIIPMIDNALQDEYKDKIKSDWTEEQSGKILIDYYNNLKKGDNWQNLNIIFKKTSSNLPALTKVRIFDIIWWSYLKSKSKKLRVSWYTIK